MPEYLEVSIPILPQEHRTLDCFVISESYWCRKKSKKFWIMPCVVDLTNKQKKRNQIGSVFP